MPRRRMREWRYSSTMLDLDIRWRWVVSFTPLLLYHRGKSTRYPLDMRLSGPQTWSGLCAEEENRFRESNSDPSALQPVPRRYTDWAIPARLYFSAWKRNYVLLLMVKPVLDPGHECRHTFLFAGGTKVLLRIWWRSGCVFSPLRDIFWDFAVNVFSAFGTLHFITR
jgi:hypothetical protein